ncbi:hypothetical protein C8R46DRAFT_1190783 [Mycena filopes]|nr:hypothetical protein C8R46DRAFT_1190783 [Mycena filopes]
MAIDPAATGTYDAELELVLLLVSSWLNFGLYTAELILCIRYFSRPTRPLYHKIGVGLLVFFDTVCTVAIGFDVVLAALPTPPSTNLHLLLTPLAVTIVTTYISAAIAQLFLSNLFYILWVLTRFQLYLGSAEMCGRTGNVLVSGVLLILIAVHVAFSWASGISTAANLALGGFAFTETTIGAISCAATDIIISFSLAWKFYTMMAGTRPENATRSLLRRIMILTVSSGLICATNTFIMMILLLKQNLAFNPFFNCQGRVYALTILGNFLVGIPEHARGNSTGTGAGTNFGGTSVYPSAVVFRLEGNDAHSMGGGPEPTEGETSRGCYDGRESMHVELDDLHSAASTDGKMDLELQRRT